MENQQMAAQVFDITHRAIFDPDTGNVFASFNNNIIPLGNIRTGDIFLYRQYPIVDGQMEMPANHERVWTIQVPVNLSLELQVGFVMQMSMYLNMGYQKQADTAKNTTVGELLTMVTDAVIPALAEQKATAMDVVLVAANTLLQYRRGKASAFELMTELERIVGFVSTMPEAFVTAPIAWKEDVKLVNGDGLPLQ
jgi:hypothetical protein